jgi:hypothetical protein
MSAAFSIGAVAYIELEPFIEKRGVPLIATETQVEPADPATQHQI